MLHVGLVKLCINAVTSFSMRVQVSFGQTGLELVTDTVEDTWMSHEPF